MKANAIVHDGILVISDGQVSIDDLTYGQIVRIRDAMDAALYLRDQEEMLQRTETDEEFAARDPEGFLGAWHEDRIGRR
jgi:hypothetical protein